MNKKIVVYRVSVCDRCKKESIDNAPSEFGITLRTTQEIMVDRIYDPPRWMRLEGDILMCEDCIAPIQKQLNEYHQIIHKHIFGYRPDGKNNNSNETP